MKILTRDDTEHDVEYVTKADALAEIHSWREYATDACTTLRCERDELLSKYAMHHAEAERMTAESIRLKCTLAKWQAWARMHGHLEHAAGIAADTREILSENSVLSPPESADNHK